MRETSKEWYKPPNTKIQLVVAFGILAWLMYGCSITCEQTTCYDQMGEAQKSLGHYTGTQ